MARASPKPKLTDREHQEPAEAFGDAFAKVAHPPAEKMDSDRG